MMANPNRLLAFVECPDCGKGMAPVRTEVRYYSRDRLSPGGERKGIMFSWVCSCAQVDMPKEIKQMIREAQHMPDLRI